jgi:hypothetical protein
MNKVGANVMGGMNHKQAISFLLRHGYSEDKLKQMLKGYSHSDSEIAEMFTESVDAVGKSDWTIKVLTDKNKVKETYEVKDKTEEEAKKEAMAKIKGKKELRATVSKVEKKEEIEETIKYRGYSIEPSGDNFYIKDSKGHRAFGEVPASVATAKKWIDLEIAEKGIKEIEESKLEPHYEILPASKYYGNHATGSVVLRNGKVEFHGTTAEAKELYKKMTDKKIEEAMIVDVKEEGTFFDRANKFLKEVNEIDDAEGEDISTAKKNLKQNKK